MSISTECHKFSSFSIYFSFVHDRHFVDRNGVRPYEYFKQFEKAIDYCLNSDFANLEDTLKLMKLKNELNA